MDAEKPLQFSYESFVVYRDVAQSHKSLQRMLRSDEGMKFLADVLGAAIYKTATLSAWIGMNWVAERASQHA